MADGKLLLAYLSAAERTYLYGVEPMRQYTGNTLTDPADLERDLQRTAARGFAVDNFERYEATRGVAVPVLGPDGQPILAMLSIGRLDPTPDQELALAREMLALAHKLADQAHRPRRYAAAGQRLRAPEPPVDGRRPAASARATRARRASRRRLTRKVARARGWQCPRPWLRWSLVATGWPPGRRRGSSAPTHRLERPLHAASGRWRSWLGGIVAALALLLVLSPPPVAPTTGGRSRRRGR